MSVSVLFVGSDEIVSRRLVAMLRQEGFGVSPCSHLSQLLQGMANTAPDLLILDTDRPADDLAPMAECVHAAAAAHLPILALTAPDRLTAVQRAFDGQPVHFQVKPILHCDLASNVRAIVNSSSSCSISDATSVCVAPGNESYL